jgi:hypothetical protein
VSSPAQILERLYPWLKAVKHIHLPDGTILYAREVWDVLRAEASYAREEKSLFNLCPTCRMPTMNCDCMPEEARA